MTNNMPNSICCCKKLKIPLKIFKKIYFTFFYYLFIISLPVEFQKSVNNNSPKTTLDIKSKDKDSDFDHLNDLCDTESHKCCMIIVYIVYIIYISKTRKWTFVQTNPTNLDCLHVEVTGEGSGTLVLNNQKQMGNVTTMYTFLF